MEQNEKTQEVPAWVKIVGDFPPVVQQSLGNLCGSVVQNLAMVATVSYDLFKSIVRECLESCLPEIDAENFVNDIVKGVVEND